MEGIRVVPCNQQKDCKLRYVQIVIRREFDFVQQRAVPCLEILLQDSTLVGQEIGSVPRKPYLTPYSLLVVPLEIQSHLLSIEIALLRKRGYFLPCFSKNPKNA